MRTTFRVASAASALALALSSPSTSSAQGLPLDRFDPAPAGDRFFGVPSPFVAGQLTPHFMALLDYAHNPLVLRSVQGDKDLGNVVTSQMFLHVDATLALANRVGVNVDLPIAI